MLDDYGFSDSSVVQSGQPQIPQQKVKSLLEDFAFEATPAPVAKKEQPKIKSMLDGFGNNESPVTPSKHLNKPDEKEATGKETEAWQQKQQESEPKQPPAAKTNEADSIMSSFNF